MRKEIKRREFGNTGIKVTEISLGAMNLRLLDTREEGISIINYALDCGINLIDTARAYNMEKENGLLIESETLVRDALRNRDDIEEEIVIVTKGHGYNIEAFDKDLATSREKLGIDTFENLKIGNVKVRLVYFFHGISKERFDEMKESKVLEHAKKKQAEGYFTYLGFSSHQGHEECINEALDTDYFEVIELPYNVFDNSLEPIMKKAYDKKIAVINMKAFGGNGMVDKTKLFIDYVDISAKKRLEFCLANEYISTIDAGARYIKELEEDVLTSFEDKLTKEECENLVKQAIRVSDSTKNTCRECMHCLEKFTCPMGVNFPKILALHTRYKIAKEFSKPILPIKEQYSQLKEEADKCIRCGKCSEWCEYKLDIPKLLEETDLWLSDVE